MNMFDLYLVLGLDKSASDDEIKMAFREKVKLYHPDSHHGGDREKFQQVKRAYVILSDPIARARYDRTGHVDGPMDPRKEAMGILSNWLRQIAESHPKPPGNTDLIGIMLKQVGKEEQSIRENHRKASKLLHRINDIKRRLSNSNGESPFLIVALDDRRNELVLGLRHLKKGKAVMKEAKSLLDDWSYDFEPESWEGQSYTISFG